MSPDPLPLSGLAGWLLTYLLHSSLLLTTALLLPRIPAARARPAFQETALKLALVGGLLTATLQPLLPQPPATIHLPFPRPRPTSPPPPATPAAPTSPVTTPISPRPAPLSDQNNVYYYSLHHGAGTGLRKGDSARGAGAGWLMGALLGAAGLGVGRRAVQRVNLQRRLARALPLQTGPLLDTLARLAHRAGLRRRVGLFVTDALVAPSAAGVVRPRVYLPRRAIAELAPPQQEALLAHELAHLRHRDPAWLALWQLFEALLFLQPLNHIARRRFQELAEFCCDAEAARLIGSGLPLARCLTEVAAWFTATPGPAWTQPATAGMANDRSTLARRVRSLLETHDRPHGDRDVPSRAGWIIGVLAVAFVLLAAPGFALPGARARVAAAEEGHPGSGASRPDPHRVAASAPDPARPSLEAGLAGELAALDADLARLQAEAAVARERLAAAAPLAPDLERLLLELDRRIAALAARRGALSRAAAVSLSRAAAPVPTRGGDLNPNPNP